MMLGNRLDVLDVRRPIVIPLRDGRVAQVVHLEHRPQEHERDDDPIEPQAPEGVQLEKHGAQENNPEVRVGHFGACVPL